jgi:beta-lactamase regulating signal transducer with metallopeptidase domain
MEVEDAIVSQIIMLMIAFGAGYGTRELISRRRSRRYAQSRMIAWFKAQETNAPKPASVSPVKSGSNVKEPINIEPPTAIARWTVRAIEVVAYIMISILLAAIGFVMLAHLMGHKLTP